MSAHLLVKNSQTYDVLLWNSKTPLETLVQHVFAHPNSALGSPAFVRQASCVAQNVSWGEVKTMLPLLDNVFVHDNGCWNRVQEINDKVHVFPLKNFYVMSILNELFMDEEVRSECNVDHAMLLLNLRELLEGAFEFEGALDYAHVVEAFQWYSIQDLDVLYATRAFFEVDSGDFISWLRNNPEIDAALTKNVLSEHVDEQRGIGAKQRKM